MSNLPEEEIQILSKLNHPNIVTLFGVCQNRPFCTIILEFAQNGSLHDYLRDTSKPLTPELQKQWMKESALALQYLHANDVLHQDVKASNCLLFENYKLKLCDFGVAREIEKSETSSSAHKETCRYMAPEIHKGNERGRAVYSKPSDIFAYGMLILEIHTRKRPFESLGWYEVVFHVGNGTEIPTDCLKDIASLMKRCWNGNPKERLTIDKIIGGMYVILVRGPGDPMINLIAKG